MFERLMGWKQHENIPRWIDKTSKMKKIHQIATHTQMPGTTKTYHFKGKNNVYRVKAKSTGQYALYKIYSRRL